MRVSNKPIIVAILPSLMMVYANADPSENAISNVADSIMLAANSTLAEPGVTGVNDWSYSVASLLAASSATAQDANSSSDQSSNNSSIASSDKADSIQTNNYATLGNRQSGEYVIDENGNKKIPKTQPDD